MIPVAGGMSKGMMIVFQKKRMKRLERNGGLRFIGARKEASSRWNYKNGNGFAGSNGDTEGISTNSSSI